MKIDRLASPRGAIAAIVLLLAGLALAWLCLRVAAVRVFSPTAPVAMAIDPDNPETILALAVAQVAKPGTQLTPNTLAMVRRAAAARPLDARANLIIGRMTALNGDGARATKLLEAGQRLNPRQRLISVFLLERYLEEDSYSEAAQQLALLSRLVGAAVEPIVAALVTLSGDPRTLPIVRRALATDTSLETNVLLALSRGDVEPKRIFKLASRDAAAAADAPGGWGETLVARLVKNGRYSDARAIWQHIYRIDSAAVQAPVYNPTFSDAAGSAPFNWTLTAGSIGAADPGPGGLTVEYYGRDTGDLASQTLLLKSGRYRFAFNTEGVSTETESRLYWQIECITGDKLRLLALPVAARQAGQRRVSAFTVPDSCLAQALRLRGEAGEFPQEINTTIRNVTISKISGNSE